MKVTECIKGIHSVIAILNFASVKQFVFKVADHWGHRGVSRLSAAFSFFAVLSLSPFLVMAVAVGANILGTDSVRENVLAYVRDNVGEGGQMFVENLIRNTPPNAGIWASVISVVATLYGASNLFLQLDMTTRTIWGTEYGGSAVRNLLLNRLVALGGILLFMIALLAWLILDGILAARFATWDFAITWQSLSPFLATITFTLLFATSYRALPGNRVAWSDVWLGSIVAAMGFALSKYILSLYFSHLSNAYGGAAGPLVLLLWIYYTSMIYFLGSVITYVYANEYGSLRETDQLESELGEADKIAE